MSHPSLICESNHTKSGVPSLSGFLGVPKPATTRQCDDLNVICSCGANPLLKAPVFQGDHVKKKARFIP